MAGLKAFRPGNWNGEPVTAADVADMVANYARFVAPHPPANDPFFVPFVSINHDDGLSFGRVTRCEADADGLMELDLEGVPAGIRQWMRDDRLTSPSIEFWPPNTFIGPDGKPVPTRVLKCVTLLGNAPPAVKALPPLSAAKYRDFGFTLKFRDLPPATRPGAKDMDRAAMIKTLGDMGFPVNTLTDAVPDETIKAFLDQCQKMAAAPTPTPDPTPTPTPVIQNADDDGKKGDKADDEVKTYRDAAGKTQTIRVPKKLGGIADALTDMLDTLRTQTTAAVADRTRQANDARAAQVKAFRDEMTRPNAQGFARMTPAQFESFESMLLILDGQTVRKFADGKTDGTALDEQFGRIRASFSEPVKKFGDQLADGHGAAGNKMTPQRRAELLSKTPEGQAILAREKAAAK